LGIALDEPRDKDLIFDDRGITYVISKDLFEKAKPILVDFAISRRGSGLKITSELKPGDSCSPSCGC
jgi:Fe-S cluster assembly iron-binding protein IscA